MELEQMMARLLTEIGTKQEKNGSQPKGNKDRPRKPERRNGGQDGNQPRKDDGQARYLSKKSIPGLCE
jgi:hypothetical protein